ncbi:MAG TPA: ADOP family duplicated permease [Acidobacteriota bacterium]|nr:ADOP family duplicated permease [Acidobacteriota bacterium]
MNTVLRGSERIYRLLLYLFPAEMRRRFGRDMAELFRDRMRCALRHGGTAGLLGGWTRSFFDLFSSAFMEHIRQAREKLSWFRAGANSNSGGGRLPLGGGLGHDLRYAFKSLLRNPASSLLVLLTLALGVGANAAMLGLTSRLLLSAPPHVAEGSRVFTLEFAGSDFRGNPVASTTTSYPVYEKLRSSARRLGAVAARHHAEIVLGQSETARKVQACMVSQDYFVLLGVKPQLGRFPSAEEHRPPTGLPVAVLSHAFWQRELAGAGDVIGRSLTLDGTAYTVVGVAPPRFSGDSLQAVDLWVPLLAGMSKRPADWRFSERLQTVTVLARLAPGASAQQAEQEAARILQSARGPMRDWKAGLASLIPGLRLGQRGVTGQISLWLTATAALVFLIALANASTLLLLKTLRRRRQTALRLALGCSRGRIARQFLAESLLLSGAGGLAGLVAAYWCGEMVRRILLPQMVGAGFADSGVLAAAAGGALLAGLWTGLIAVWQSGASSPMTSLRGAGSTLRWRRSRLQAGLLVAQTAVSMLLLVGAGLFLHSLYQLVSQDLGFESQRLALARLEFPASMGPEERDRTYRRLEKQAERMPEVTEALPVESLPFGPRATFPVGIPGRDADQLFQGQFPRLYGADPGFFQAMGIDILAGRAFTASDRRDAQLVAVVNQSMARAVWPQEDPLGKCLRTGFNTSAWPPQASDDLPCRRIVGVAADTRPQRLRLEQENTAMQYYLPFEQLPEVPGPPRSRVWSLLVRTEGHAEAHLARLQEALRRSLPSTHYEYLEVRPYAELMDPQIRPFRLGAALFSLFGALALAMAAVGLYGVLAYSVAQRRPEIGVRMALGAASGRVARLIALQGLRVAFVGVVLGGAAALAAAPLLSSQLYRTRPYDPWILSAAVLTLTAAALLASLLPAWRASRTDPNQVLRTE